MISSPKTATSVFSKPGVLLNPANSPQARRLSWLGPQAATGKWIGGLSWSVACEELKKALTHVDEIDVFKHLNVLLKKIWAKSPVHSILIFIKETKFYVASPSGGNSKVDWIPIQFEVNSMASPNIPRPPEVREIESRGPIKSPSGILAACFVKRKIVENAESNKIGETPNNNNNNNNINNNINIESNNNNFLNRNEKIKNIKNKENNKGIANNDNNNLNCCRSEDRSRNDEFFDLSERSNNLSKCDL